MSLGINEIEGTELFNRTADTLLNFVSKTVVEKDDPISYDRKVELFSIAVRLFVNRCLPKVSDSIDPNSIASLILTGSNGNNPGIECLRDYLLIALTINDYRNRLTKTWLKTFTTSIIKDIFE